MPFLFQFQIDGVCYLIQEIFGIENKNSNEDENDEDSDAEDDSSDCVVCLSELRDTMILPCRHLCLCSTCGRLLCVESRALLWMSVFLTKMVPVTNKI